MFPMGKTTTLGLDRKWEYVFFFGAPQANPRIFSMNMAYIFPGSVFTLRFMHPTVIGFVVVLSIYNEYIIPYISGDLPLVCLFFSPILLSGHVCDDHIVRNGRDSKASTKLCPRSEGETMRNIWKDMEYTEYIAILVIFML